MNELNKLLQNFAEIFGYEQYDEELFKYLKKISKPNNQICNKNVKSGEGGWKCKDCENSSNSLICVHCFEKAKEKHKNHKILFEPRANGYCDCGDPNSIKEEGFCPEHLGPFKDYNSLMNYIKSGLNEKIFSLLDNNLDQIFKLLSSYIFLYEKNKEKIAYETYKIIDKVIDLIENCYKNNLCIFHLITLKLINNYPMITNHQCFSYDENTQQITTILDDKEHKCICPILQLIINCLIKKHNNHNSYEFLTFFIQNLKIKLILGISLFHSFTQLFETPYFRKFSGFSFQIFDANLFEVITNENNIEFYNNFLNEVKKQFLKIKKAGKFQELNEFLNDFYKFFLHFPHNNYLNRYISNNKTFEIIIDIISEINNFVNFENKTKFAIFQKEGFDFEKMICEIYPLFIFNLLTTLLDYSEKNIKQIKYILKYILLKISKYKDSKKKKTLTFHISLGRLYAIFINRFCISLSIEKTLNLYDAFIYIQELIPKEYSSLHKFLLKELLTFFTFMCSLRYRFFTYYGENMRGYPLNYFMNRLFIQCDFVLFKYLISLNDNVKFLELNKLLEIISIEKSNEYFRNKILENKKGFSLFNLINRNKKDKFDDKNLDDEKNNFLLLNSILELILTIIRDDNFIFELTFECVAGFKMTYKDPLLKHLYNIEKNNLNEMFKKNIFIDILSNNNLVSINECIEKITTYKYYFEDENVEKIIVENCDKVKAKNNLTKFSLNKESLASFDLDYIQYFEEKEKAKKYLMDFKKKEFNLLNTVFSTGLNIETKLNNKNIENFIIVTKNYNQFLSILKKIIADSKVSKQINLFIYIILKYLCVYIKYKQNKISQKFKEDFLLLIQSNKIKDEEIISYFEYIKNILKGIEPEKEDIVENKIIENNEDNKENKEQKNKLRNKYKNKFIKMNKKISEKLKDEIDLVENEFEKDMDNCIICRERLDYNNLKYFYGTVCYCASDYFNYIMSINKKVKKIKNHRFVSCNHKCHFDCYLNIFIKYSHNKNFEFKCSLCKKLSNCFICDLSKIYLSNNEKNISYIKGLEFQENLNINDFILKNIEDKFLGNHCENFVEYYASKLLNQKILLKDINSDIKMFKLFINKLFNDFMVLFSFYSLTENKQLQIDIWKNILLSIRLLFKFKRLNHYDILLDEIKQIVNSIKNIGENSLLNEEIAKINIFFGKFIFLFTLFFEYNKNLYNELFNNLIQKNILPLFVLSSYYNYIFDLKQKNQKIISFNDFINNPDIYNYFQPYYNIYNIQNEVFYKLLINNDDDIEQNSINEYEVLSLEQCINLAKSTTNINIIEKNMGQYTNKILKCFNFVELNFINLPESCLDFYSHYSMLECSNCHMKEIVGYICLICGEKICNLQKCVYLNKKGKNEFSLIGHSKRCTGGNSIYLSLKDSQIVYYLKRKFVDSEMYLYVNKYGEHFGENYLPSDFNLDKKIYEKAKINYIDLKFRQKLGVKIGLQLGLELNNFNDLLI